MDPTNWVWRSEVADHRTIASLQKWVLNPPQDETEHAQFRAAFAALATETRRLRAVLGHCPRSIAVLDMEGRVVGYNHEFELQLGDALVLGDSLGLQLDEPDRTLFESVVASTSREG